jgi:hypothetical protein
MPSTHSGATLPPWANVVGLVYVAAFGIDEGESLGALLGAGPPTPALANLAVDEQGFGWLPEADFVGHFAGDLDPAQARVLSEASSAPGGHGRPRHGVGVAVRPLPTRRSTHPTR